MVTGIVGIIVTSEGCSIIGQVAGSAGGRIAALNCEMQRAGFINSQRGGGAKVVLTCAQMEGGAIDGIEQCSFFI